MFGFTKLSGYLSYDASLVARLEATQFQPRNRNGDVTTLTSRNEVTSTTRMTHRTLHIEYLIENAVTNFATSAYADVFKS